MCIAVAFKTYPGNQLYGTVELFASFELKAEESGGGDLCDGLAEVRSRRPTYILAT